MSDLLQKLLSVMLTSKPPTPTKSGDGPDFTNRYNTKITPEEEKLFQKWLVEKSKVLGRNVSLDLGDYDIRGGSPWLGDVNDRGHGPDTWKKPNHPTFSNESVYNGVDGYWGGKWGDNEFIPGKTNLEMYSPEWLERYMQQVEPGVALAKRTLIPGR